jgi:hypothetical protein
LAWGLSLAAVAAIVGEGLAVIGEDFTKDHPTLDEQIPLVLNAMIANREMILWSIMLLAMAVPYLAAVSLHRQKAMVGIKSNGK